MEGEFPEDMKCPICYEIPVQEIYHCRNGHLLCHTCANRVENCPKCNMAFETPRIRCRGVEQLLDMMKFNCIYKSEGCTEKLTRKQVDNHSQNCSFGGEVLKLCGLLGLSCGFVLKTRNITAGFGHLKSQHQAKVCHFAHASIRFKTFALCEEWGGTRYWNPVIFCKSPSPDADNFVFLAQYNSVDKSVSFSCLLIRKHKGTKEAFVKFVVKSPNPSKILDITWLAAAVPMSHAASQLNQGTLRTPISILKTYLTNGELVLHVTICEANGTIPNPAKCNTLTVINVSLLSNVVMKPGTPNSSSAVASTSQRAHNSGALFYLPDSDSDYDDYGDYVY